MTKLFFDHLISFEEIETVIKKTTSSKEEKEELWGIVDEIVNHKVIEDVLDKIPKENHEEFLTLFHKCPHDEVQIFEYLKKKTGRDLEPELKNNLKSTSADILKELKPQDEVSTEIKVPVK